jgi:hypothetical protein
VREIVWTGKMTDSPPYQSYVPYSGLVSSGAATNTTSASPTWSTTYQYEHWAGGIRR